LHSETNEDHIKFRDGLPSFGQNILSFRLQLKTTNIEVKITPNFSCCFR